MQTLGPLIGLWATLAALAAAPAKDAVPLFFVANHGQAPPTVQFMAKGSGLTALFLPREVVFHVGANSLHMRLEGVAASVKLEAGELQEGHANFLTGPPENWRSNLPTYRSVVYRSVYPGIDMVYGGHGRDFKSEFIVAPGADPSRILVRYGDAGGVRLDQTGALIIPLGAHELREEAPAIYQNRKGQRIPVEGRFRLSGDGGVTFEVADYDRELPLIIDPTLSFSTLLGGSGFDTATALAVDGAGAAYVAGYTDSYDFPTAGPAQSNNGGSNDVFVAKLNPSGNGLVYCTYLGGSSDDRANGIAVDASGAAYLAGSTASRNFPVRNALQAKLAGPRNAFVLKLTPAGNGLVFSTYLGGKISDIAYGIAIDSAGNSYVVGDTTSPNFPVNGYQRALRGAQNAFVTKLSTNGSTSIYSTYLGGGNLDHGAAIAVDASGSAYITGSTYSSDFPLATAFQSTLAGGQDAFVSRLSATGTSLVFSSFLGGSGGAAGSPEGGQAIALDSQGNAYITGVTSSQNFPVLSPVIGSLRGWTDAFVAKVDGAGTLQYSTYLGGCGFDVANGIAVDSAGSAYVVGYTNSMDLPVINAQQATLAGDYDAFVATITTAGNTLQYLSYLGGSGSETATAVALDPSGNVYVTGLTLSTNFPLVTAYQSVNAGNYGSFIAKLAFDSPPAAIGVSPSSGSGKTQTFSFQWSDPAGASDLRNLAILVNSSLNQTNGCSVTYDPTQNLLALLTDSGAQPGGFISPGSGSQQNSQCVLSGTGSSVTTAGTVLTLNLALTFNSSFSGTKNVYLSGQTASGASTGWQQRGSWTVPVEVTVTADSVSPASGSGVSQSFQLRYSDTGGATGFAAVSVVFGTSATAVTNACDVVYTRQTNSVTLLNDAASAWSAAVAPGTSSVLQNSQCSVNLAATSVSLSGNTLTLTLSMGFAITFNGTKNVYLYGQDGGGNSSGWQQRGTWTVPSNVLAVTADSVWPASGAGTVQGFQLRYSDTAGASSLTTAAVFFGTSLSSITKACDVAYTRASNSISLLNDSAATWSTPTIVGSNVILQNSQCSVNLSNTSVSSSGNTLTLNLAMGFTVAFNGTKNVYLYGQDAGGTNSGWQQRGAWIVPNGTLLVTADSASPSSGTGASQTFAFQYSDTAGALSFTGLSIFINAALYPTTNACSITYNRSTNTLALLNDAGTVWSARGTVGSSPILQNSQCSIALTGASVSISSNVLTLTLPISFSTLFHGAKNVYLSGVDVTGGTTGWQQSGTWTVP